MEICPLSEELFRADGQTDRYDQANGLLFFQFCLRASKGISYGFCSYTRGCLRINDMSRNSSASIVTIFKL